MFRLKPAFRLAKQLEKTTFIKLKKPSPHSVVTRLPPTYQKFLKDLQKEPAPVHYIPDSGKWKIDPDTKEKVPVENVPIPLQYPKEADNGIWGGEAVIRGFIKRKEKRRRCPNFWVPKLKRSVVYSEILNKYFTITVTERTLQLIDKHYGFDNYILETPVQDLKSQLAFDIRRHMLLALANKEKCYDDPEEQEKIYKKYKKFEIPKEDAEWFGLSLKEAIKKQKLLEFERKPEPLKHLYRQQYIQKLKAKKEGKDILEKPPEEKSDLEPLKTSWVSKIPFVGTRK